MDIVYAIAGFSQGGGAFMYPILFVAAAGTAIGIERWITLTRLSLGNRSAWGKLEPALSSGDFDKARQLTNGDASAISRLLSMGLSRQGAVRRREDIEIAMEESMM